MSKLILQDLKIKSRYAIGGETTYIELETLLDVLQAGNEVVATYSLSKQAVTEGRTYKSVLSIVSNVSLIEYTYYKNVIK